MWGYATFPIGLAGSWAIVSTPPSNWCRVEWSSNWAVRKSCWDFVIAFLTRSAHWRWQETWGGWRALERMLPRITWQSTSICLVCSWNVWLLAIQIALVLSTKSDIGPWLNTPNSQSRWHSQTISLAAEDIVRCSTSADDFEIVDCLLHFQEIEDVP